VTILKYLKIKLKEEFKAFFFHPGNIIEQAHAKGTSHRTRIDYSDNLYYYDYGLGLSLLRRLRAYVVRLFSDGIDLLLLLLGAEEIDPVLRLLSRCTMKEVGALVCEAEREHRVPRLGQRG